MIRWLLLGLTVCWGPSLWADESTAIEKPSILLLKVYDGHQDVTGWLMSEKLDGVRAIWDGQHLVTRQGHEIYAPQAFLQSLPPFALDGELWTKRGDFANIVSIVRQAKPDNRWQQLKYYVFEVPNQAGGLLNRLEHLRVFLQRQPTPWIELIPQEPVVSKMQLQQRLKSVVAMGGEGLVVRDPNQVYAVGRLATSLKVKTYEDTECKVTEVYPGQGRFSDKMGALGCELASGLRVKIGTGFSDALRQNPPAVGTEITFKYYGLTEYGKPRFPVFLRIRENP